MERVGPEAIGEDDGAGGVGAVIARVEQAAEDGVQAHHVEVGAVRRRRRGLRGVRRGRPW